MGFFRYASYKQVNPEKKMYEYEMEFENVTRKHCGSEIKFNANGLRYWEKSAKIMVRCKQNITYFLSF